MLVVLDQNDDESEQADYILQDRSSRRQPPPPPPPPPPEPASSAEDSVASPLVDGENNPEEGGSVASPLADNADSPGEGDSEPSHLADAENSPEVKPSQEESQQEHGHGSIESLCSNEWLGLGFPLCNMADANQSGEKRVVSQIKTLARKEFSNLSPPWETLNVKDGDLKVRLRMNRVVFLEVVSSATDEILWKIYRRRCPLLTDAIYCSCLSGAHFVADSNLLFSH